MESSRAWWASRHQRRLRLGKRPASKRQLPGLKDGQLIKKNNFIEHLADLKEQGIMKISCSFKPSGSGEHSFTVRLQEADHHHYRGAYVLSVVASKNKVGQSLYFSHFHDPHEAQRMYEVMAKLVEKICKLA